MYVVSSMFVATSSNKLKIWSKKNGVNDSRASHTYSQTIKSMIVFTQFNLLLFLGLQYSCAVRINFTTK